MNTLSTTSDQVLKKRTYDKSQKTRKKITKACLTFDKTPFKIITLF